MSTETISFRIDSKEKKKFVGIVKKQTGYNINSFLNRLAKQINKNPKHIETIAREVLMPGGKK